MRLYRINTSLFTVTATARGDLNTDIDGVEIFENTHFASERLAWEHLSAESEAAVRFAAQDVEAARSALLRAHEQAAEAVVARAAFVKRYEAAMALIAKGVAA